MYTAMEEDAMNIQDGNVADRIKWLAQIQLLIIYAQNTVWPKAGNQM